MKLHKEFTYYHISENDMVDTIYKCLRRTDLNFYRIETFMSPNFLRIKIYILDEDEVRIEDENQIKKDINQVLEDIEK